MHKTNSTWKKVLCYIRPYSFYVILSLLFAVLTGVLTLYAPIDHPLSSAAPVRSHPATR